LKPSPDVQPSQAGGVAGRGSLVASSVDGRSTIVSARAHAPLLLRTPRLRRDAASAFVGSLGGGFVDGDAVSLDILVRRGATLVVTTQASTKVYRGARGATQTVDARVEEGGLLELVPDPLACFAGSRYAQETRVRLEGARASVVIVDTLTCGRRAFGERWAFARYASRLTVLRDGRAALADATLLDASHGSIAERMGRWDVFATVVAAGPRAEGVARAMLAAHGANDDGAVVAASPLRGGGAIARIVAVSAEASTRRVGALLSAARS
jgi:urease accessory protein